MKQLLPELSDLCPNVPFGTGGRVVVPKADPPKA